MKLSPLLRRPLLTTLLVMALAVSALGCPELLSLLGPAAGTAGAAVGSYEKAVQDTAKAQGLPASDPRVLAAVQKAQALAEKRAAEDRARDAAGKVELDAVLAELRGQVARCAPATAPSSPPPPARSARAVLSVAMVVDAGAGAPPPFEFPTPPYAGLPLLDGGGR